MKVLVAAAGTGGHINPALAIANEIKKREANVEIIFVGTTRGLEKDLVPRAGYPLKTIEVYGISREISLQNIKKMMKTIRGFGEAKKLIKEMKPDLVIGTGGYICGPIFLAATKQKIPTVLHESNAFPGFTVRLLAKKVDCVLLGFAEAKKRLTKAKKLVVTGNPTKIHKQNLSEKQIEVGKKQQGLDAKKPMVLVFGGSQGARPINEALLSIIENKKNQDYTILWAVGPKQYDKIKEKMKEDKQDITKVENAKIVPYIYQMEDMLNLADLAVCRSGAMTITEMAKVGKPAIFLPLPFAAENHQEYNAKVLEKVGAAKILHDSELTGDLLHSTIMQMVQDKEKLKQMGERARTVAKDGVEEKIYEEIKQVVKEKKQ